MALEDPIARQVRYLCGLPYLHAEEEDMLEEALEHWHLSRLADQEVRTLASGERFAPLSQGDAQSLLDARIRCRFHRKQALRLLRPICQAHGAMIGGWFSPFAVLGILGAVTLSLILSIAYYRRRI